jgi:hypothetical protein
MLPIIRSNYQNILQEPHVFSWTIVMSRPITASFVSSVSYSGSAFHPKNRFDIFDLFHPRNAAIGTRGAWVLEGMMAKHLTSRYYPGRRSVAWRKIKPKLRLKTM